MNKAVFLDRDGVINPLVYNPKTSEYESPHCPEDFSIFPYVGNALKKLKNCGYLVIVVSNQPSYAKGKTSFENIKEIAALLESFSNEHGKVIDDYYYCYHHPDGVIAEFAKECQCRKPGTKFLKEAIEKYEVICSKSFFVGDCDTDIVCGERMELRTIKLEYKHSKDKNESTVPWMHAENLMQAVDAIVNTSTNEAM